MTERVDHLYEDTWGSIVHRPGRFVEIRWYDTTRDISGEQFKDFLVRFADLVEEHRCSAALVDATSFLMDPSRMDLGWRDVNIIPRYNAAGMKKFAFHMPEGMPAVGKPPGAEPPASYPTGYFGSRAEALAWLAD